MKFFLRSVALAAGVALLSTAAVAGTVSGSYGGTSWTATNHIIGQTSTATAAAGGDPRYFAAMPKYSGVAALIMNYAGGSFICSGSLMPDRRSILTAAHCVTPDAGTGPLLSTTAYFYGGSNPDTVVPFNPLSTAVSVSNVLVHPAYTGNVIDQNDVAVLRLGTLAPGWAVNYGLSSATDLTGAGYNIAGYGGRSDTGGAVGVNLGTGRLRQGDNRYDFRLGDADFGGGWGDVFSDQGPLSQYSQTWLSDFDNGLAANDASCVVAVAGFGIAPSGKYCNTGVGAMEVSSAGGDSGGPQFDASMNITSITSFGLTFGAAFGDIDNRLNDTWGEFNGFVPVGIHRDFIRAALVVPEPGSMLMVALAGLALVGTRRRRVD